MITLKNDLLTISINPIGAELWSVLDNHSGHEFLWQGDAKYWGRKAPVLFPNIGCFKDNQYAYQGQTYELPQHGFARDMTFHIQNVTSNTASFYVKSTPETLKNYPFDFSFQITYILQANKVTVTYEILNPSTKEVLYYNVGGHPGFNVSETVTPGAKAEFDQVSFNLEPQGHYLNIHLTNDGLVDLKKAKYTVVDNQVLTHRTFRKDALVYQIGDQTEVILTDASANVEIRMKPNRMGFMGIWSSYPARAGFVCLEPWAGIADAMDATGNLEEKYGVLSLEPRQINTHDYTMTFTKKTENPVAEEEPIK